MVQGKRWGSNIRQPFPSSASTTQLHPYLFLEACLLDKIVFEESVLKFINCWTIGTESKEVDCDQIKMKLSNKERMKAYYAKDVDEYISYLSGNKNQFSTLPLRHPYKGGPLEWKSWMQRRDWSLVGKIYV